MNDHQRKMARKSGRPAGYRAGGDVPFRRQAIAPVSTGGDASGSVAMADGGAIEGRTITDQATGARVYQTPARVREIQDAQKKIESQRRATPAKEEKPPADAAGPRMASGGKVKKVMHEFKHGELHSGSKGGPLVKNRNQAIAIALSEQRKGKP